MKKEILLHICCAPCATAVVEKLRSEGYSVFGLFYNPSIHPWKEFERRLEALKTWAPTVNLDIEYCEDYDPESSTRMLLSAVNRCMACFSDRMEKTANTALKRGIGEFTTTLTISPYQNQQLLQSAGSSAAGKAGVRYVHRDFRDLYKRSIAMSRDQSIYRQPYCGCLFSERDRYLKVRSPGER